VGVETVAGADEPKSPMISSTVLLWVCVGVETVDGLGLDELPNISARRLSCPFGAGPAFGGISSPIRSAWSRRII
jgi:hypothetical protein